MFLRIFRAFRSKITKVPKRRFSWYFMVFGVFTLFAKHSQNFEKLKICKSVQSHPKKLNFQDFQTISGRSWKLLHSNPQNDVIFGRFQRQRFFYKSALQKSTAARPNEGKLLKIPKNPGKFDIYGRPGPYIYTLEGFAMQGTIRICYFLGGGG